MIGLVLNGCFCITDEITPFSKLSSFPTALKETRLSMKEPMLIGSPVL